MTVQHYMMDGHEETSVPAKSLIREQYAVQPKHCNDILNGGQRTSGIYTIFHKAAGPSGQTVYCDMDVDGGGWTVIQQRGQFGNNVYYFYRNWTEYAEGFGVPAKEFWIGNRALHALTSVEDEMMLRIVLTNTTEDQKFVDYESVKVANEDNFFQLQLGKFVGPSGWDALSNANGHNFSTFDSDNDAHPEENCALHYRGAWWYNRCHLANLNAEAEGHPRGYPDQGLLADDAYLVGNAVNADTGTQLQASTPRHSASLPECRRAISGSIMAASSKPTALARG
ncbi:techylectin-5A-like [Haemaphysalis longicornis]